MMRPIRPCLLALLLSGQAAGQLEEPGGLPPDEQEVRTEESDLTRRMSEALAAGPGAQRSLARRILASSLAERLSVGARDPARAEDETTEWVRTHADDAAHLAVGFAQDDRDGTRNFETSLNERVRRYLMLSPDRHKGILGVLGAAGQESKFVLRLDKKMAEEEQRELIKQLFEGRGSESSRVLTQQEGRPGRPADAGTVGFAGVYDRLSELNPSGYSPKVLALQSALNAQRPAGAPKLIETGRLDFPTLMHPIHALRQDFARQDASLKAQRAWAVARALGREHEFRNDQYGDPAVQAKLQAAASGLKLPPRLDRRRWALQRAQTAAQEFERAAARMRDPSMISREGLRELSSRQKEAARWLMIADLEADLHHLETESTFWTQELEGLVRNASVPDVSRRGFLGRAKAVRERLARIRVYDEAALACLTAPNYVARWAHMERQLALANGLRWNLSRDIALLRRVPPELRAAGQTPGGWRAWLERLLRRFVPSSSWARAAEIRERRTAGWSEAFVLVAAGDFARAQRAAAEASRR